MVAAVFAAILGALFGAATWFMGRLINGIDSKFEELVEKIINNSTKHFEEAEKKGNRITELETYVKMLLKLLK